MMAEASMKLITTAILDDLAAQAGASQRLRCNYNVHEQPSDPIQRLFIAACLDSYFRPHRHPGKKEFAIVLRGLFDVITFDHLGRVNQRVSVGPDAEVTGLEIPADVWHTWVPMEDRSLFFEVKPGPYDPATVVEFAGWSPAEGSAEVPAFYEKLLAVRVDEKIS
jgi:cupin fold WbuC family metalloprotein